MHIMLDLKNILKENIYTKYSHIVYSSIYIMKLINENTKKRKVSLAEKNNTTISLILGSPAVKQIKLFFKFGFLLKLKGDLEKACR